jgi:hypothetical protein
MFQTIRVSAFACLTILAIEATASATCPPVCIKRREVPSAPSYQETYGNGSYGSYGIGNNSNYSGYGNYSNYGGYGNYGNYGGNGNYSGYGSYYNPQCTAVDWYGNCLN